MHSECQAECAPSEDEIRRRREGQPVVQEAAQAYESPDQETDQTPAQPFGKILKETRTLERENAGAEKLLTARQKSDIEIITRMYRQQQATSRTAILARCQGQDSEHQQAVCEADRERQGSEERRVRCEVQQHPG